MLSISQCQEAVQSLRIFSLVISTKSFSTDRFVLRLQRINSGVIIIMDNIKLYYFDLRGKGEFIRLLLRAAGQKFDDVIVPRSSWGPEGKAGEKIDERNRAFLNTRNYFFHLHMYHDPLHYSSAKQ